MSDEKVVYLRSAEGAEARVYFEHQISLFDTKPIYDPKIVMVDPDKIDHGILAQIVVRNGFKSVLDLRPNPTFRKPKYNHKKITEFFYTSGVRYFEIAMLVRAADGDINRMNSFLYSCFGCNKDDAKFTLCLADQKATEQGIVRQFRSILRIFHGDVLEVHPSAILI